MKKVLAVMLFVSMIVLFVYYSTSDMYNKPLFSSPNTGAQLKTDSANTEAKIYFPEHPHLQALLDTIEKSSMDMRLSPSSKSAFLHQVVVRSDSAGRPSHIFVPPQALAQLSESSSLTDEERQIVLDKIQELRANYQYRIMLREDLGHPEYFPENSRLQAIADSINLYTFRLMSTSKSIYIHDANLSSSDASSFVIPRDLKTMLEMDDLTTSDRAIIEKVVAKLRIQYQERDE